jgi:rhodanese-related sulfurtransferase
MMRILDVVPDSPDPRRMSPVEAHLATTTGRAILLDVRDARLFDNAHIENALAVPLAEIEARDGLLPSRVTVPEGALLIPYCA